MKKVTLFFIIFFFVVVGGIFTMSLFYPTHSDKTLNVPVFNMAEVSKHNTENDCYLVISNKVYDVSNYIGDHPGGREAITSRCGEEVTGIFASIHSNFAWDLLTNYYIGEFVQ